MTNYQSAIKRIKQADTIKKLKSLDKSFGRVYSAGFLTVSEFTRLDLKLCDKKDLINKIDIPDYMIGKRVQIPAWSDRWMMGDRYGEIVSGRNVLDANNNKRQYKVKLDKSDKLVKFFSDDLTLVD